MSTIDDTQQTQLPTFDDEDDNEDFLPIAQKDRRFNGRLVSRTLIVALLMVGAFMGGVTAQKHHGSGNGTNIAARGGAPGGNAGGRTSRTGGTSGRNGTTGRNSRNGGSNSASGSASASSTDAGNNSGGGSNGGGFGGGSGGGFGGSSGGGTTGTVKVVDGNDVYITDTDGNLEKVSTDSTSSISITSAGKVTDLKPGQSVVVRGTTNDDGTISATSISQGASGFGGGGFGGGGFGGAAGGQ
jgi:hypothetical protein